MDDERLDMLAMEVEALRAELATIEGLRDELQGMRSYFDKAEAMHKAQLDAAHQERNELRDVIRELRSMPPEERKATTDDLTDEERDLIRAGKIVDAIKSVRSRTHVDLRTAKAVVDRWRPSSGN